LNSENPFRLIQRLPDHLAIVRATDISWAIVGPFILIALGVITLVKAFYLKDETEDVSDLE
jgi:hypothetical protein